MSSRVSDPLDELDPAELERLVFKLFDECDIGVDNGYKTSCVEFFGSPTPNNYARVRVGNKTYLGHRLSFEWFKGPIPDGHIVHHDCEITLCVGPDHLFAESRSDHTRDHAADTCPKGHNNWRIRGDGRRECRDCANARRKDWTRRTGYR